MRLSGKFGFIVAAASLSVGVFPVNARAYCLGWDKTLPNYDPAYYSIDKELSRSRFIVRAKVIREIWVGEDGNEKELKSPFQKGWSQPRGSDPYLGAFYELQVENIFKGDPPKTFRVFSENSTARFSLRTDQVILAFVSHEAFDAPIGEQLTLDTCGNFRPFPQANAIMPAVLAGAKRGH